MQINCKRDGSYFSVSAIFKFVTDSWHVIISCVTTIIILITTTVCVNTYSSEPIQDQSLGDCVMFKLNPVKEQKEHYNGIHCDSEPTQPTVTPSENTKYQIKYKVFSITGYVKLVSATLQLPVLALISVLVTTPTLLN